MPQIVRASFGLKHHREVHCIEGHRYRVEPLNPAAKKNRGRECVMVDAGSVTTPTRVRFVDTKRLATVDPGDLISMRDERGGLPK